MTGTRRARGFTLVEVTLALTLLAVMLAMLFAGLRLAARAWDSGSARSDRADQLALTTGFLRRELALAFPWRFRDASAVRLAFNGSASDVKFVSMRPADLGGGGLAFVSFQYEGASGPQGGRLVMRRSLAAAGDSDFSAVDAAEAFTLLEGIESLRFSYYGAENDIQAPAWSDTWQYPQRLPSHVRLEARLLSTPVPDVVVALRLGEEAGCVESGFQRTCVPRR